MTIEKKPDVPKAMIRNIATDEKIFPDQTTDWEKISLMYMLPCWFEMTQGICWVFTLFQQENKIHTTGITYEHTKF